MGPSCGAPGDEDDDGGGGGGDDDDDDDDDDVACLAGGPTHTRVRAKGWAYGGSAVVAVVAMTTMTAPMATGTAALSW